MDDDTLRGLLNDQKKDIKEHINTIKEGTDQTCNDIKIDVRALRDAGAKHDKESAARYEKLDSSTRGAHKRIDETNHALETLEQDLRNKRNQARSERNGRMGIYITAIVGAVATLATGIIMWFITRGGQG